MIGSLGDTVFEVRADVVRTFTGSGRSSAARYEDHPVHLRKPVSEFTGLDLDDARLSVRLDATLGVEPMDEIERMRDSLAAGEVVPFILGDRLIMDCTIRGVSEQWKIVSPSGRVLLAVADISLKEHSA